MKFLIMHGSFTDINTHWFRWLEAELLQLGHEVILKQYPIDKFEDIQSCGQDKVEHHLAEIKTNQNFQSWEKTFTETTLELVKNEEIIFVGHSLAPIFFLRMAEKYNLRTKLSIFVSPFFNVGYQSSHWVFHPVNYTFYKSPAELDMKKIRGLIPKSYVVNGDDDPYLPQYLFEEFSKELGSSRIIIPQGKHCGSNYHTFPQILDLCQKLLS